MTRSRILGGCLALAVALSGLVGWEARAQMTVRDDAIGYALENLVSGTSTTIRLGETSVSVTPLRTWKSVSGHWCRRYELVIGEPGDAPERSEETRCRQEGVWRPVPDE